MSTADIDFNVHLCARHRDRVADGGEGGRGVARAALISIPESLPPSLALSLSGVPRSSAVGAPHLSVFRSRSPVCPPPKNFLTCSHARIRQVVYTRVDNDGDVVFSAGISDCVRPRGFRTECTLPAVECVSRPLVVRDSEEGTHPSK